jgi:tetratricopeptide (TPR) repeat protein
LEAALARAPRSAAIQAGIAEAYFQKGDHARAAREAEAAMELDASHFASYITAGNAYMILRRTREAFLAFNAALTLRPSDPSALYNMGVLLYDQNRFAKAAELLQQAAAQRPGDAELLFRLGMSRLQAGDMSGAAEALRACLAESPGRSDAQINLASVQTQLGHHEEARLLLEGVLGREPGHPRALQGMGVLSTAVQDWPAARGYYERAIAEEPAGDPRVLYNLAGVYEKLGDRSRAAETYREFLVRWSGGLEVSEDARARLAILEAGAAR